MTSTSDRSSLIELWLLAAEGEASDEQLATLNERIIADPSVRDELLALSRQQGWLAWNAAALKTPSAFAAMLQDSAPAAANIEPATAEQRAVQAGRRRGGFSRAVWRSRAEYIAAAGLLLACSLAFLAGRQWHADPRELVSTVAVETTPVTMVRATGAIWGDGAALQRGEDLSFTSSGGLQLLEGIADFKVRFAQGEVGLEMEGPASLALTPQGTISLNYGKIIVDAGREARQPYPIETALGRIVIERGGEVGVISFGSKAEIHCFRGRATIESPWLRSQEQQSAATLSLEAGGALRFEDVGGAVLEAQRIDADRKQFVPQVSMTSDFLSVNQDYVREIVAAQPAAYWRFENAGAEVIRNEVGDRFACRAKGEIAWVGPEGNRAIEMGVAGKPGLIVADDRWDEVLSGDFAIEAWIKPSHYHLGSIVGFVGEFDPALQRNKHGVLLEVGGPSSPNDWTRLRQLRFLHRSQLSANAQHGVSAYSGREYAPRRWQHVVAVKSGANLRLYLDGELVDAARDESATPQGLRLVIGQLYTETVERFFIGQLDEVAIYPRVLTPAEIVSHYELLRKREEMPQPAA